MRVFALAAAAALGLAWTASAEARTYKIKPGPEAGALIAGAFQQARDGDRIKLARGRYEVAMGLATAAAGVSIEGAGESATVLTFRGQTDGQPALRLSGPRTRVRGLSIEDAMNGAIYAEAVDGLTLADLVISYTEPSPVVTADGVAVVRGRNILLDTVTVVGAADAGVALSQSASAVIRMSRIDGNGVGLLLEETSRVDAYDNTINENGVGVAAVDLPQVSGEASAIRVFRNQILRNNRRVRTSALLGTGVPPAVGVLALSAHDMHVFQNAIGDHGGANVVILSAGGVSVDAGHVPVSYNIVLRDNVFGRSGFDPQGTFMTLRDRGFTIPDVLWDGVESYGEAGAQRTLPVRIPIVNNVKQGGGQLTVTNLGIGVAGGSLDQAQPSQTLPPGGDVPEPAPVALPQS